MDVFPINLLIPVLILAPNVIYAFNQPLGVHHAPSVPTALSILERIGQISMIGLPLFFPIKITPIWGGLMIMCLALYYFAWLRYFKVRTVTALYQPFIFIPLPLAALPSLYFFCVAALIGNPVMFLATTVFAVAHISVSFIGLRKV